MNEEEKKQLEEIKYKNNCTYCNKYDVDFLINLIEKLEKVIDEMTKYIEHTCYYVDECGNYCDIEHDACNKYDKNCNECIKQYFYRKVKTK